LYSIPSRACSLTVLAPDQVGELTDVISVLPVTLVPVSSGPTSPGGMKWCFRPTPLLYFQQRRSRTLPENFMPRLRLRSIKCFEQQETFTDELYVTFNGTKRSLPNMKRFVTQSLNDEFLFTGTHGLRLYENDGDHWYDRDDFIAAHDIPTAPGDYRFVFKGDGAEYAMDVSVIADSQPATLAILRLNTITCLEQAEFFTDELYVTFNGRKRSLPNMTKGQTTPLSDEFLFDGSSHLSLFENDGDHWYDRDDFIGTHRIDPSPADYTLTYEALVLDGRNPFGGAYPAKYELDVSVLPVEPTFL
jgi:hypothetical protein